MSMKPHPIEPIPQETAQIARKACKKGTLAMRVRDELFPIYQDELLVDLFAHRGRPAEEPWRLLLITVLQVGEGLTDRQAAEAVRTRLDWKYALSLPLEDEGFDSSVLTLFRERLIAHEAVNLLLAPILQACRERGWLKAGGKQRTDSTAVLASVRSLNSLESVGESMRAALNALAEQDADWIDARLDPQWFDRYVHRFELARFPKEESKRSGLREQVGQDVNHLLALLGAPQTPDALQTLPQVRLLQQIFAQHYEVKGQHVHWRDGPTVTNSERVVSPYDPQAKASRKRETSWLGYKVHLTETCDQDPRCPHLVVQVQTTAATLHDSEQVQAIADGLQAGDLAPSHWLVDQGYPSGPQLVRLAQAGIDLLGPVPADTSWQQRQQAGYSIQDFHLDWQQRRAVCPQGVSSTPWIQTTDKRKIPIEVIRFPSQSCQACPVRECCTHGEKARSLTLNAQGAHEALLKRRGEQFTPAFLQRYHLRAGVEGTIAQAVKMGARRTPYQGTDKTHLHHVALAAAINFVRLDTHLQAQARGRPSRPVRPPSPLARLHQRRQTISAG